MSSFAPGTPESYINAVNQKLYGTAPTTAQPMQQSPSYPQYPMGQQLGMPNSLAQINKLFNTLGPQQKPLNPAGPGVGIDPNFSLVPQDPYSTDTFPVPPGFQPIGPGIGGRPFDPTYTDTFPIPPGLIQPLSDPYETTPYISPGMNPLTPQYDIQKLLEMLRGMGNQPQTLSPIPAPPQQKPRDRVRQNEINQVEKRLAMLQNMPNARQAQLERATNRLNRLRGAQQVAPGLLGLLG